MATKDSEELKANERYPLGDYSFRIERSSVPGSTNDKIEAICTDKDGKNARKSIQTPSSTELFGWYVEANETEATVYIRVKKQGSGSELVTTPEFPQPITAYDSVEVKYNLYVRLVCHASSGVKYMPARHGSAITLWAIGESADLRYTMTQIFDDGRIINYESAIRDSDYRVFNYDGKTAHRGSVGTDFPTSLNPGMTQGSDDGNWDVAKSGEASWMILYGDPTPKEEEIILARFNINIEDAGGVGPGGGTDGGWTDPEDYDEDWEEGDPTHTLYVEVTGALSGRHNDPIVDPSYSYIPADKDTVKGYGCGGDGGHGGGGGAGASTVVIHKFATNQANSKEVTAIARRHGYGSGGGKGGKGGDGCILVYY